MILCLSSEEDVLKLLQEIINKETRLICTIKEFETFKDKESIDGIVFYSHLCSKDQKQVILAKNAYNYIQKYSSKPTIILTTNGNENKKNKNLKVIIAPANLKKLNKTISSFCKA